MRRVSVTELKNALSRYLRIVKQGETIEILERSVAVARIAAIRGSEVRDDERLDRLARDGIVTKSRKPLDRTLLERPPLRCGGDPVRALVEARGER